MCSESEAGWENDIKDDVLEECSQAGAVFHIHVDKHSQGNVYVECASPDVASAAFARLNGRFFAGSNSMCVYLSSCINTTTTMQASRYWFSTSLRLPTTSSSLQLKELSLLSSSH